jgi:hypothetical protein
MENDKEDVSSYWKILRKGYLKLKVEALARILWRIVLEEVMDLS